MHCHFVQLPEKHQYPQKSAGGGNCIPNVSQPSLSKLSDLQMLVMLPGEERMAEEYEVFSRLVGFRLPRIILTPSPYSITKDVAA